MSQSSCATRRQTLQLGLGRLRVVAEVAIGSMISDISAGCEHIIGPTLLTHVVYPQSLPSSRLLLCR